MQSIKWFEGSKYYKPLMNATVNTGCVEMGQQTVAMQGRCRIAQ